MSNPDMVKTQKRFLLGIGLGVLDVAIHAGASYLIGSNPEINSVQGIDIPSQVHDFFSYTFHFHSDWYFAFMYRFLYVIVVAILASLIGEVITAIVRIFTPSTKILTCTKILEILLAFVVWLPITAVCIGYLSPVLKWISAGFFFVEAFVHVLLYATLYTFIGSVFGKVFTSQLKKDTNRCKLELCRVLNENEFVVEKVIVTKRKFHDCYGIIRNNEEPEKDHFYRITEMNFSGKEIVKIWKYYANGNFAELPDLALCRVIYRNYVGVEIEDEFYG